MDNSSETIKTTAADPVTQNAAQPSVLSPLPKADAAKPSAPASEAGEPQQADMTIEEAFARLQQILAGMEQDGTTLEDSFRLYEEGMKLVKLCSSKIDRVEKKVQMMSADGTTTDFT